MPWWCSSRCDAGAIDSATAAQEQSTLRERAVLATGISFTVVDATVKDVPLVWVNPAFNH